METSPQRIALNSAAKLLETAAELIQDAARYALQSGNTSGHELNEIATEILKIINKIGPGKSR